MGLQPYGTPAIIVSSGNSVFRWTLWMERSDQPPAAQFRHPRTLLVSKKKKKTYLVWQKERACALRTSMRLAAVPLTATGVSNG